MNNVAFLDVLHTADMLIAALQLVFYAKKKTKPTFIYISNRTQTKKKGRKLFKLLKIAF